MVGEKEDVGNGHFLSSVLSLLLSNLVLLVTR
jgi:hypothetical protein